MKSGRGKPIFYLLGNKDLIIGFPQYLHTLLIAEILSGKNARAWVSMDFTQDKFSAPIAIEKIKILGAPWELLAKQHCQSSPFTSNLGQIGQIGSAV